MVHVLHSLKKEEKKGGDGEEEELVEWMGIGELLSICRDKSLHHSDRSEKS